MLTRRKFLSANLLLGAAGAAPLVPQNILGKLWRTRVQLTVRTDFPRPMSLTDFNHAQKEFVLTDQMTELSAKFQSQGRILTQKNLRSHLTHSVWEITFDSLQSYEDWNTELVRNRLVDDKKSRELGYRFDVRLRYV